MLPIHAVLADLGCPRGVSAADRFAEVGGLFIEWVEAAYAAAVPGFLLPVDATAEPEPGHAVRVESDRPDAAHERFRITWRQPALFEGGECVQEYAVARAGDQLAASVLWHLTSTGPVPLEHGHADRPAILDRLLPFVTASSHLDGHPLAGLARRDLGAAFRAVAARLEAVRARAERDRAALYTEMEAENRTLAAERDELRLEVDDLNETVYDQRSLLLALGGKRGRGNGSAADPFEPATLPQVVERIKQEFPHELVFLKSAEASAADTPYQSPGRVYELLHALGDIARRWRTNTLHMEWFEAFQRVDPQFVYKPHLSQTTATSNWEDYAFLYDGTKRLFEPHVSLGKSHDPRKCLSVHWYRDEDAKRVVVGWCGRHLPNTRS